MNREYFSSQILAICCRLFWGFVLLAPLSACGFQPLYASTQNQEPVQWQLARIHVAPIANRVGQILRNHLLDRVSPTGAPQSPLYELRTALKEEKEDLGIQKDATATFARLEIQARYQLVDLETNKIVFQSAAQSASSYNVLASTYATLNAEEDARARAAKDIADLIAERLAIYFRNQPSAP